jgi:hypothetical protein
MKDNFIKEAEKEFKDRFTFDFEGREYIDRSDDAVVDDIKNLLSSKLEEAWEAGQSEGYLENETEEFIKQQLLKELEQDKRKLLEDYSDWLHKHGYIDADYYTEEPHAVDAFLDKMK